MFVVSGNYVVSIFTKTQLGLAAEIWSGSDLDGGRELRVET